MEMNKYSKGKIYMVITENSNDIYVGSTTLTLKKRLTLHESDYRKGMYCSSQEILKQGNYKIVLIKNYPCSSRLELEREEGKFQRDLVCVNKFIAGRTKKEYYEDNREAKIAKQREYSIKNREVINAKQKIYYNDNKGLLISKKKEYYNDNREVINAKSREYWEQNREAISAKRKVKYECACGGKYRRSDKAKHFKTKKHQKYILQND